jgi:membrane-associated protease RseP (regulator of RpoE activity)
MTDLRSPPAPPPPAPKPLKPLKPVIPGKIGAALLIGLVVVLGISGGWSMLVVVLSLVLVITLHELGHYLTAKWAGMKVTQFFLGFGPTLWSTHRGETEYGVKLIPAGAFVRIIGMHNLDRLDDVADEPRSYREADFHKRLIVVSAGSAMHFLIAFISIWTLLVFHGGPGGRLFGDPVYSSTWTVNTVEEGSAAANAGLQPGDRVEAIDGQTGATFDDIRGLIQAKPGEPVALTVERGSETINVTTTLGTNAQGKGFLGVSPKDLYAPVEKLDPLAAVPRTFQQVGSIGVQSVQGIGKLFSPSGLSNLASDVSNGSNADEGPVVNAPGQAPSSQPSGGSSDSERVHSIIGITQIGSDLTSEGWAGLVGFLVVINVFFGIFNLLPFLPFDGGHVAVAVYEKIRSMMQGGRRYYADFAKLLPVTYAVVALLVFVSFSSMYLDIVRGTSLQ